MVFVGVAVHELDRAANAHGRPEQVPGTDFRRDVDERDIARFRRGAPAKAYPRGEAAHEMTMRFVRVEPFVVPMRALTGENTERVDTRVLQVLYAVEGAEHAVYVGQQLDVFIDGDTAVAEAGRPVE